MKKLSFLIIFIMFINLAIPKVQANESGTILGGIINSDTILTAANSPYFLTKDLQLAEGVKLTIEEGVTIDGKGFSLTAWGALDIRGTSNQVVKINNLHINTGSQSYYSQELPPTIDIQFAHIQGGSLLNPGGSTGVGNLSLRDSVIKEVEEYKYSYIWYPTEDVYIERNIFLNAGKLDIGIDSDIKVYINNNVFYNDRERSYYNDADIVNWVSYSESEVLVRNNSFLSPEGFSLKLKEGYDQTAIDGRENYWGTVDETEISNKIFDKNDDLRAASYIEYQPYLEEPHKDTPEFHYMKIPLPTVFTVYDYSTVVEGHLGIKIASGKVIVKDWAGEVLGVQEGYDGVTDFKVSIPKQHAEIPLYVTIVDQHGNESEPYELLVEDGTPPKAPTVYPMTDVSLDISGKTEPYISVKSVSSEGKFLGETQSDMDGEFVIPIEMQKAGTKIIVTAMDYMSNVSDETSVIVQDSTLPLIPSFEPITDQTTQIIGKAEAMSTIIVTDKDGIRLYSAVVKQDGSYLIPIDKQDSQKVLYIFAEDTAGNQSDKVEIVVIDATKPLAPKVDEVNDKSEKITGKAEADSSIQVKSGSTEIGMATANVDGTFTVSIPKQKAETKLFITATDAAGNRSDITEIIVLDTTVPAIPVVDEVTDQSVEVTGTAEAAVQISVKAGDSVIGTSIVKTDGTYAVSIPLQKAGTKLSITATDAAGNISTAIEIAVLDVTEPAAPTVNEVTDKSTTVTGTAEVNALISVKLGSTVLGETKVEVDGTYAVLIAKQKAETKLSVTAKDSTGNISSAKDVIVLDVTAPTAPTVNKVTDQSTIVGGVAEAASQISVKVGNSLIGTSAAKDDGTYSVSIPKQKAGTVIAIKATDKAGNISAVKQVSILDGTPPSIAVINKITHHSTRVIGTAEADAKIEVLAGTKSIGTANADSAGKYEVTIAKQKVGTKLSVVATDAAGNSSKPILVTVADGNYPDLKITHWALEEIMYLADDQIIGGYPNGEFQSEKKTTRAEAAKMLVLALDLPLNDVSSGYKDVTSKHWAKNYIAAASKAGLFNGNPDGTFAPDKTLKRSEMAKIISIAYDFKASGQNHFTDVKSGYWAKGYISGLYDNGITTGYPDDTFRAEESTTRAEFSVFLARALNSEFR
ncbi:Ig-like domain-containing protein [Planomicrobium sp. MB-3u-38]|uniref:Ig-like domain-containing protein n=1 Tax=Planomicrobium sp. MB-3u-38 TaxID=2058318 RepID=UPI000C7D1495|nr:Ig-like domain-containing protein [Planomicrobium sp. MB-3u-38]PKH10193.1 hypothetical protein CXF70_10465 [Planomicrobium sp. MB-3u-38]